MRTRLRIAAVLVAGLVLAGLAGGADEARKDGAGGLSEKFLKMKKAALKDVQGDVGVLFLGDSITAGWMRNDVVDLWRRSFGSYNPVNFGIPGYTTGHVLGYVEHGGLEGVNPKAVVLLIGVNNTNGMKEKGSEIAADIRRIVEAIRRAKPESRVIVTAIFPRGIQAERNETEEVHGVTRMAAIAEANRELAALDDGKSVRVLDLTDKFLVGGKPSKALQGDLLHLTPKGYALWAAGLVPLLGAMGFPLVAVTNAAPERAAAETGSVVERKQAPESYVPVPGLPSVLVIGDSISMGYLAPLRKELAGKANVFRPLDPKTGMQENCNGTTYGVANLDRWLGTNRWAVIHFNFGLHDLKHVKAPGDALATGNPQDPPQAAPEVYAENLAKIVGRLKETGARLVFATTTPVAEDNDGRTIYRNPADVPVYNAAALRVMQKHGTAIDDLYGFCLPRLKELQRPRNVHFTDAGSAALAKEVARSVAAELAQVP